MLYSNENAASDAMDDFCKNTERQQSQNSKK